MKSWINFRRTFMCGIVGYIGNNAATEILLSGLKSLEYRGYDSAGIALNDNKQIKIIKAEGKLANLTNLVTTTSLNSFTKGIGHIRWATHGAATVSNAHPHRSNSGKITLVHNGIIENYQDIRSKLVSQNYTFFSDTDTEAVANLIDYNYQQSSSLEEAVIKSINTLKGAFAFCILCEDNDDEIIAVRKSAPLIIGLGDNENFIASDIPAIIGKAKKIVYLDDGEYAIVKKASVIVKDFSGNEVDKKIEDINFAEEAISKHNYKHFMLKEINEQSDIIRNILSHTLSGSSSPVKLYDIDFAKILSETGKVEIIACGTSLHSAMIAKHLIEEFVEIPVSVEAASEYIYRKNITDEKTLTIGISQSGETADTITAIKQAKAKNAKILVATNRLDSSIVRHSDYLIPLNAGIEVSVAATKSYTAQLISLFLLSLGLAETKGSLSSEELKTLKQDLLELPAKMEHVLSDVKSIKQCANILQNYYNFFYLARGINLATAFEGALKLKEISYLNAAGYPAGELKHGPIALLDESSVIVAVLTPDSITYDKMLSNCEEAKARGAKLVAITSTDDANLDSIFNHIIKIPHTSSHTSPILSNVALQILAYHIADNLGREIDQPRNLAKSVTVE